MSETSDLFGEPFVSAVALREEERFGKWDAITGVSLRNYYSHRISGARLAAYERAFREERSRWLRKNK